MALALRAASSTTGGGAGTSVNLTLPATINAGDLLIVFFTYGGGSVTASQTAGPTLTQIGRATQTGHSTYAFYRPNCSAGDAGQVVTFTYASSTFKGVPVALVLSGANAAAPIDASNSNVLGTGSTSHTIASATTVAANCGIVEFVSDGRGASTPQTSVWTPPTGEVVPTNGAAFTTSGSGSASGSVGYNITSLPAGGSAIGGDVWTADQSAIGESWVMSIKPASGTATPGVYPTTLTAELNRLANGGASYPLGYNYLDDDGAACKWAGVTGMSMLEALNYRAGNTAGNNWKAVDGVCQQLAGVAPGSYSACESLRRMSS